MKRFILAAAAFAISGGVSFSQTAAPAKGAEPTKIKMPAVTSMAGKVQSITEADVVKGTKSEITVAGADATVKKFLVKATTTIYNNNGKSLTLKDLQKNEPVKVNYKTSAEGVLEALAIYQTK